MLPYCPPVHHGLDIIYLDKHLLAVNKPAGLLAVPGRGKSKQDCMASRAQAEFPQALVVHRLDMATSGIMLFALGQDIQKRLGRLFESRQVDKSYEAIVDGLPENDNGIIDEPLICDWPNRPRQIVDHANGKPAFTRYEVRERHTESCTSRVLLKPVTGRSHQLRVHMQSIGHPILGDELYNIRYKAAPGSRLLLHASKLAFIHPVTGEHLNIVSSPAF